MWTVWVKSVVNLIRKIRLSSVAEVAVELVVIAVLVQVQVQVPLEQMLYNPGIVVEGLRSN
jgi:hypothetical protein